jgi:transcriptional regulator with XRE-family HTH domain
MATKKVLPLTISGKALVFYREKAGLTQTELAEKIGAVRGTVAAWEAKESITLKDKQVEAVLAALSVDREAFTLYRQEKDQVTQPADILDHPVIKSLVKQSEYIMGRVVALEEENKRLRGKQ